MATVNDDIETDGTEETGTSMMNPSCKNLLQSIKHHNVVYMVHVAVSLTPIATDPLIIHLHILIMSRLQVTSQRLLSDVQLYHYVY